MKLIQRVSKNQYSGILNIISADVYRLSKFFHCQIPEEIMIIL